ncbi:MAG: MFS transporter [Nocardioidaceae bacterium]
MPAVTTRADATPVTAQSAPCRHVGLAIVALALGGFGIGTTEFVTMGLLPQVADGVHVSIPAAGHVITAYALGVVVGAPLIAALGARLPRRALLIWLMVAFGAGNAGAALAGGYHALLLARFLSGLPHGAYFGVASLVAASLVPPHRRARAVSQVMLGLAVANVVGVPAATWMGQQLGWRSAYWLVAIIAVLTATAVLTFVPHQPPTPDATLGRELKALRLPQVWLTLLIGTVGFGGMFAMYSYIAPTVTQAGHMSDQVVPVILAAYGLGGVVGTVLGGRAADHALLATMVASLVLMAGLLALFTLSLGNPVTASVAVFAVAVAGVTLVICLQMRLMDVAGEAQTLGAALNHSSLNVANALGAWLGGVVIAAGYGYRAPSWVGVGLALGGLGFALGSVALHRRTLRTRRCPDPNVA